jgi:hypothetical protein
MAAIIAWREFAVKVRDILDELGEKMTKNDTIWDRIARLPENRLPAGRTHDDLKDLWRRRNYVMKDGDEITPGKAAEILDGVAEFIEHNTPESAFWQSPGDRAASI